MTGEVPQRRKVLLLGIGNTVLTDDGIGIHAVRLVRERAQEAGLSVEEAEVAGFALLDVLEGFDAVVVVDAVKLADAAVGQVVVVDADTMPPSLHLVAGHQVDLPTALALGRQSGIHMPAEATVVGVQIDDDRNFGTEPTAPVAAAASEAAELALRLALDFAGV
jgi:hydrogenase maturation protease